MPGIFMKVSMQANISHIIYIYIYIFVDCMIVNTI